jgi:hypothetical protein
LWVDIPHGRGSIDEEPIGSFREFLDLWCVPQSREFGLQERSDIVAGMSHVHFL